MLRIKKKSIVFAGAFCLTVFAIDKVKAGPPASVIAATSPERADVELAISKAANGDTITVPAGQAVWTEGLAVTKNITVQGAGLGKSIITFSAASQFSSIFYPTDTAGVGMQRVTGFTFTAGRNRIGVGVWCNGNRVPYTTQRRIDHCKFINLYCGVYVQDSFGVSDHNEYTGCAFAWRHAGNRGERTWAFYDPVVAFDSSYFFFHEDEVVTLTGDSSIIDAVDAQNYVIRNSKFHYLTGATGFPMCDAHGDYANNGNQWGNMILEIYGNTFNFDIGSAGAPLLALRGGKALVFNNTVTGPGSASVQFREESYEALYYGLWPLPATDVVHDTYVWNNTLNGFVVPPYVYNDRGLPNASSVIRLGQEYFTTPPNPLRLPPYPHPLVVANGVEPSGLLNISTRGLIQSGDRVLIAGFLIAGNTQKVVMVRALGPSLPLSSFLSDPVIELHDATTGRMIQSNDNWMTSQQDLISASGLAPTDSREAAVIARLSPGGYTVVVRGAGNSSGIGLVEIYDLDNSRGLPQLSNISTRGYVLGGDNVLIGGFIVYGRTLSKNVVIRATGPSLIARGVNDVLADPTLELRDRNGNLVAANDNWKSGQMAQITAIGLAPSSDSEAAVFATLLPGHYTAILAGKNGATGVGLVEIYSVP